MYKSAHNDAATHIALTNTAEETRLFGALIFNNKNLLPLLEEADVD